MRPDFSCRAFSGCLGIFRGILSFPVRLKARCSAMQLTLFLRLRSANRTNEIERFICQCHFSLVPLSVSKRCSILNTGRIRTESFAHFRA